MNRSNRNRRGLGPVALAAALFVALLALPGAAAAKDRNHDRIPDRWEKRHHLSLKVNQAHRDQDRDQLRNRAEFLAGDNPHRADSDGDGIEDGEEKAGTIQSFDSESGRLVIDLFGGDTVSGIVTAGTEIACEDSGGASISSDPVAGGDEEQQDSEAGDDSGQEEPGEDGGDSGQEAGGDGEGAGEQEPGDDDGAGGQETVDGEGGQEVPGGHDGEGGEEEPGGHDGCTAADLVPGAVVKEAELKLSGGQATFEKVELSGKGS